ncbi:thioredoxin family protein [Candidatus Sumerlaeota bacterium]|nr:thioredoxin family protein [Candidatus Sumerlaeota bacterium]
MHSRYLSVITLTLLGLIASSAPAQITIEAQAEPSVVPPGGVFEVAVTLEIDSGWHIYGFEVPRGPRPTRLRLGETEDFTAAGAATEPEPLIKFDPGFQVNVPTHEGSPVFRLPVRAGESLTPGPHTVPLTVDYQLCTEVSCLRPARETLEVEVTIDPSATSLAISPEAVSPPPLEISPTPPEQGTLSPEEQQIWAQMEEYRQRGLLSFLYWAAVFGFASLLTPCVFPMIPITVSLFTKRGEQGRGSAVGSAGLYALSIIATYTVLGLILAALWGASGARNLAANPWINLGIGALFIALALSLFGLFELRLPGWLLNAVGRGQQRGGRIGIVFMGIAFTLTSFTCTVAFVGFLLAQAAMGDWLWPGLGMLVFSTAFALPFFLLALFPQMLSRLPASGDWLHITKVLMGLLELAAAFKFLSNADLVWDWGILRNTAVLATWTLLALLMTLSVLGLLSLRPRLSPGRIGIAAAAGLLTAVLAVGLVGGPLPLWIATYLPEPTGDDLEWHEDLDEAMAQARETGQTVFIDFTGYTCTNCRQMELEIFPDPEVHGLLEQFVRVKLFTDDQEVGDRWATLQERRFGSAALPMYVLLTPGDELIAQRAGMVRPAARFAEFLREGLPGEG